MIKMLAPSILGSSLTIAVFLLLGLNQKNPPVFHYGKDAVPAFKTVYTVNESGVVVPLDFVGVSKEVMDGVVHIKSTRKVQIESPFSNDRRNPFGDMFGDEFFRYFYGDPNPQNPRRSRPEPFEQVGTGSGVIISSNGYIVTNNHVVDQADDIEVTLHNNDVFKAKVIGTDPSTDLALLQIKKEDCRQYKLAIRTRWKSANG